MNDDAAAQNAEIVIIRRKGPDDLAAGKGGAWKIAYADFVTAMMAFFLVMWLINASNEATRAQVASYFNPIKLTDTSTGNRGLKDRKENKSTNSGNTDEAVKGPIESDDSKTHEEIILQDPMATLDGIAASIPHLLSKAKENIGDAPDDAAASRPSSSSPGVGDPFDPRSWDAMSDVPPQPDDSHLAAPKTEDVVASDEKSAEASPMEVSQQDGRDTRSEDYITTLGEQVTPPTMKAPDKAEPPTPPELGRAHEKTGAQKDELASLASTIEAEISAKLGTGLDDLPASIEVKAVDNGVLISLTDKADFGMFRTGSAEPEPQMLQMVNAIALTLADRKGHIVIRGHTDSRPYRNKKFDNWQLSTARAHFAQYMLIRGGLDQQRIRRIEGVADREPKLPNAPEAAPNRRIEILLGIGPT